MHHDIYHNKLFSADLNEKVFQGVISQLNYASKVIIHHRMLDTIGIMSR